MFFRSLFITSTVLGLAACGAEAGDSPGAAQKGRITLTFTDAETDSQAGGFLVNCKVSATINNRFGEDVSRVGARFSSLTAEDADLIDQATGDISEEHLIYIGDVARGETLEDTLTIRGLSCEGLAAVRVNSVTCQTEDRQNCNSVIDIQDGGVIRIVD